MEEKFYIVKYLIEKKNPLQKYWMTKLLDFRGNTDKILKFSLREPFVIHAFFLSRSLDNTQKVRINYEKAYVHVRYVQKSGSKKKFRTRHVFNEILI